MTSRCCRTPYRPLRPSTAVGSWGQAIYSGISENPMNTIVLITGAMVFGFALGRLRSLNGFRRKSQD